MSNKTIYLSKDGKVFGPYSKEEYSEIKKTADFHEYSWIWTEDSPGWVPINPPTVPPTGNTKEIYVQQKTEQTKQTTTSSTQTNIPTRPALTTQTSIYHHQPNQARATQTHIRVTADTKIKAICHNEQELISGDIQKINDNEFILLTTLSKVLIPPFGSGHQVVINLLDLLSGTSENVSAKITDVKRSQGCWEYRMQWLQAPKNVM